jgi:hypothetical protein
MKYVLYTSTAVRSYADHELYEQLVAFRDLNEIHGITGMLLYNERRIIQYIE